MLMLKSSKSVASWRKTKEKLRASRRKEVQKGPNRRRRPQLEHWLKVPFLTAGGLDFFLGGRIFDFVCFSKGNFVGLGWVVVLPLWWGIGRVPFFILLLTSQSGDEISFLCLPLLMNQFRTHRCPGQFGVD